MIIGGQRSMNASTPIGRGLGISAGLEAGRARDLAVNCERLGYHSLWSNDEPTAAGLETLAQFAGVAPQLELGVGVLPLDRHQPVAIAAEIARLGLDPAKLWVGVGSGQLPAPLHIVQRAVAELRQLLPERTRIVVAAMRPRLCRASAGLSPTVCYSTGCCLLKPSWRVAGCWKEQTRRAGLPRSSLPTSASP